MVPITSRHSIYISGGSPGELWQRVDGSWVEIGSSMPASLFVGHPVFASFADTYPHQIFGFSENDYWVAVADEGTIFRYHDGEWEIYYTGSGLPASTANRTLFGLYGIGHKLYLGLNGTGDLIYWDGSTWADDVTIIAPPGAGTRQNSCWAELLTNVLISAWDGSILKGSVGSWTQIATVSADLHCVWGLDHTHIFAGGTVGDILHSSDGGLTWVKKSTPVFSTISSIWGSDSTHVWAVTLNGEILFYDGTSWSLQYEDPAYWFNSITGLSDHEVYAVGGGPAGGCLFRYSSPWAEITSDFPIVPAAADEFRGIWLLPSHTPSDLITSEDDDHLAQSWVAGPDFPLRFGDTCDLAMTTDDLEIQANMRNCVMIRKSGLPLRSHLGSLISAIIFDPNDEVIKAVIGEEVSRSIAIGEPRAYIDPNFVAINQSEHTATAMFPYTVKRAVKWGSFLLSIPSKSLDK